MKLILMEDIPSLGTAGNTVEVAPGYARNFLIPQGKALAATAANLARAEKIKAKRTQEVEKERTAAEAQAALLSGVSLTISQRVGEEERLYGSVTTAMIAEALAAKGFEIDKKDLELEEPIKKLGAYDIAVRLGGGVKAKIQVEVVPENA